MALYNLIGHRRRHDVIDAVPLLAEKLLLSFAEICQLQVFVVICNDSENAPADL